jgi:flagellar protein FliS
VSYNQALSAYRETRVKTASQGALIIMLYDETIKQIGAAVSLIDDKAKIKPAQIEKINTHIVKSQEIITELMASLNMDAGGEISRNLLALYTFFNEQLLEGNIEKNRDKLIFVRDMMDQLRLAWVEAVNTTAAPATLQNVQSGINIAG